MDWPAFHFSVALLTLLFALGWVKTRGRNQHVYGAALIFGEWIACWLVRNLTGDIAPTFYYALIDVVVITAFYRIMITRNAAWAAVCVLLHALMLLLHLAFFISGGHGQYAYLTTLGVLTFLCAMTINSAILTGMFSGGERVDHFFASRFRGATWSGIGLPRDQGSQAIL